MAESGGRPPLVATEIRSDLAALAPRTGPVAKSGGGAGLRAATSARYRWQMAMARDSPCATRMTQPRNVRPGVTWLVTRRATRRHFLFNPDDEGMIEQLYWYTTAVYAQALGIELHVMELMSNHDHEVLTDTLGQLCRFLELRTRVFANALKVFRGWPGEKSCWTGVCSRRD